jgi:hypothetical protein
MELAQAETVRILVEIAKNLKALRNFIDGTP